MSVPNQPRSTEQVGRIVVVAFFSPSLFFLRNIIDNRRISYIAIVFLPLRHEISRFNITEMRKHASNFRSWLVDRRECAKCLWRLRVPFRIFN